MSNITPDQIKAIATRVRSLEKEKLNASLPNNTLLNAITVALGLGADYRAYKGSFGKHAAAAPTNGFIAPPSEAVFSALIIAVDADPGVRPFAAHGVQILKAFAEKKNFQTQSSFGQNGFAKIEFTSPDATSEQLEELKRDITELYQNCAEEELPPFTAIYSYQAPFPATNLRLEFAYREDMKPCSAMVMQCEWDAARATGLTEEQALMLCAYDVDIDLHYTDRDIKFLGVIGTETIAAPSGSEAIPQEIDEGEFINISVSFDNTIDLDDDPVELTADMVTLDVEGKLTAPFKIIGGSIAHYRIPEYDENSFYEALDKCSWCYHAASAYVA